MTDQTLTRAILHTLAYGDVFDYPLTAREIHRYLPGEQCSLHDIERLLEQETAVARCGEYFCLPGREGIAAIRERRAVIAARLWNKALAYGGLIACLPFVRMLAVTGSLAVDNPEEGKDIDYMIVARAGFVWTCRALVLLVVRLARLDRITLCPNYLVSERALELPDHSLYAARELAQMVPLTGLPVYERMREANVWVDACLPNARGIPERVARGKYAALASSIQHMLEFILQLLPVERFEALEMKLKIRKLSAEQSQSTEAFFSSDVCKGHVDLHGEKILNELDRRVDSLGLESSSGVSSADTEPYG